ncbi:hypothetical protein [Paenibacillus sp. XY044]|uniref:hypothetical protein n=1 Tax=Paenibacillus sp. XY044 TaxID=2026089 RepID=UPI00117DD7FD|nr:hypothetical protein [Paenibacillus sp. XY044]
MSSNTANSSLVRERELNADGDCLQSAKTRIWSDLSRSHMNLAILLKDEGQLQPALILAHMAAKTKLKEVALHLRLEPSMDRLPYEDLIGRAREIALIDLETELFLNTLSYISEPENMTVLKDMHAAHMEMILERVRTILEELSWKTAP